MGIYKVLIAIVLIAVLVGGLFAVVKLTGSTGSVSTTSSLTVTIGDKTITDAASGYVVGNDPLEVHYAGAKSVKVHIVPKTAAFTFYLDGEEKDAVQAGDLVDQFDIVHSKGSFTIALSTSLLGLLQSEFAVYEVAADLDGSEADADLFTMIISWTPSKHCCNMAPCMLCGTYKKAVLIIIRTAQQWGV